MSGGHDVTRRALEVVRPSIRALTAYSLNRPAGEGEVVRLDFNEAPHDVPAELKAEVLRRLGERRWSHYPEFGSPRLVRAIAAQHGVEPEQVVVGNGSGELLLAAVSVFAGGGGTLLLAPPTFSLYQQMALLAGAEVATVPRRPPDFALEVEAFSARAADGERTVPLLCAPNNPTGNPASRDVVARIARESRVLLLDQAYVDFSDPGDDAIPLLPELPHLVVFRTLSKAFAAAGFRIGYALAHAELAREIRKAVLPFSVDLAAEELALALLERPEFSRGAVETVRVERERVRLALLSLGASVAPAGGNFLFFTIPGTGGAALFSELARRGVVVREPSPAAPDHIRVTVGTRSENDAFLRALEGCR